MRRQRTSLVFSLLILAGCHSLTRTHQRDKIDLLVERLNGKEGLGGLWKNGEYPIIRLPESTPPEKIAEEFLRVSGFDPSHRKGNGVLEIKQVRIEGYQPDQYWAALVQTDFGTKIVLIQHERDSWWTKFFDAT